ncbi:diaminopimelate epimerase [Bacteroidota bacterium]
MIHFFKYQATGNDFVMIDNRMGMFDKENINLIEKICDRRFGVGGDGVILVEEHVDLDFEMIYYNSDGTQSLCGNGSRAAVMFTRDLGIIDDGAQFMTISGELSAGINGNIVHLLMPDVSYVGNHNDDYLVDTGSPHYVRFTDNVEKLVVETEGPKIRFNPHFEGGINANFAEITGSDSIFVRTYERGVEAETYSCGTGVTACALAGSLKGLKSPVSIQTLGGKLQVSFENYGKGEFRNIYLIGPAEKVFEGDIVSI